MKGKDMIRAQIAKGRQLVVGMLILFGLYLINLENYLLFHSLGEVFSIVVAGGIFMVSWNSRQFLEDGFFLLLGIAYLFVGGLDLVHTLAYRGMGVFPGFDTDLPTQLWIVSRYVESLSLLIAPLLLNSRLKPAPVVFVYTVVVALVLGSIFYWQNFPSCFVEGTGLTAFKKISEYIISSILLATVILLWRKKREFDRNVFNLLVASVLVTVCSEITLTFYISADGFSNFVGHILKIISFCLIYKAVIETGLARPYNLLFRDLKESERKYRELFDNMSSGVALVEALEDGTDFAIRDINKAGEKISKVSREDIIGRRVTEVFPGIGAMGLLDVFRQVWGTGKPQHYPVSIYEDDRLSQWVENAVYRLPTGQVIAIYNDVTARQQVEREMIHLERLRASCELSAGISHNLNNILTGILGPAQLLKMNPMEPTVLEQVDEIIAAAMHARDLVHRLHLATRGIEEQELQPVPVNQVAQEAVQTVQPRWKDESEARGIIIDVITRLGDVSPIQGTASRLHDIFVNLLLNAVDAMPGGGTITIDTRPLGEGVQIQVRDTGIGMDEETRRRIFEPFFTTKTEIGTGLGLATVLGTVTSWGGAINVESTPGMGTAFTLWLPASREAKAEVRPVHRERADARPGRQGKVLVVDDDEGVGRVLDRLLNKHHIVEIALDGRKALDKFAAGQYDVALIDLGMPGMSGDQVLQQIQRKDGLIATVLITGWEIHDNDPMASQFDFHIQKPFESLARVEEVVAKAVTLRDERAEGKI